MLAVATRFVAPVDNDGRLSARRGAGSSAACSLLVLAASVLVIYMLEILKFERGDAGCASRVGGPAPQPRSVESRPRPTPVRPRGRRSVGTVRAMSDPLTQKWICEPCGMIYDPEEGDPDGGVDPGTPFADIPDNWVCPVCGARKRDFVPLDE